MARRYLNAQGQPIARAKKGELVTVELVLRAPAHVENAVIVDLLPAGLELEDSTFETRSKDDSEGKKLEAAFVELDGRAELRDDRWLWFGELNRLSDGKSYKITYRVRAVTPGAYAVPSLVVEDMYNPDMRGSVEGEGLFTVE